MSGGGLLSQRSGTVGMYPINVPSQALTATKVWLIGSAATATVGIAMPFAVHLIGVYCAGHCLVQVGTPTVSITAWKTNQTAGSEIMTATSAATGTGTGLAPWSSNTVVNAGKDALAAGSVLLISAESAATSATILSLNVLLVWTWD